MTIEEVKQAVEEFKAAGKDDEEILAALYTMFQNDKLDIETLEAILHVMGYKMDEDFKKMSPEDQKTKGYEEEAEGEEKTEEEKFPEEEKPEDEPEDGEEDERKQARKLFGFED